MPAKHQWHGSCANLNWKLHDRGPPDAADCPFPLLLNPGCAVAFKRRREKPTE
jgi:hypothetical protein